jgi:hypothetical protein
MAFYYVKSGGTATGDAGRSTTARTGSFAAMGASAYYPTIKSIFADQATTGNTAVDGDTILVSDLHSESHAGVNLMLGSVSNYLIPSIISVSDSDVSVYSKGAIVEATSGKLELGSYVNFKSGYFIKGLIFNCSGTTAFETDNRYSKVEFIECDVNGSSSASLYISESSWVDCNVLGKLVYGSVNTFSGGSLTVTWSYLTSTYTEWQLYGVDLSGSAGSSKFNYGCTVRLENCKLYEFPPVKSTAFRPLDSVSYIGCGVGNESYSFAHLLFAGEVISSEIVYLNYKYDGANFLSGQMNSNSSCSRGTPLRFKLCEIPAQNLATIDTTYRVNLLLDTATKATLSDSDFFIEVKHSSNANLALGETETSRNTGLISDATELTASAETWQGTLPATNKAYQVDITLSAAQLTNVTNGNVTVWVNLATPNTDVYVCPAVQIGT